MPSERESTSSKGRATRCAVVFGCLLLLAGACGFERGNITATRSAKDSGTLTDGVKPDTNLTDSGFTSDTASSDTTGLSDYTDSSSSSSDTGSTGSSTEPPANPTPLIALVLDPPGHPATRPTPGPPAREAPAPDGTQKPVNGTYTYDNLDDYIFGDWSCLRCDTQVSGFGGAVDKLGRTPDDKYASVSVARFADASSANKLLTQVDVDRTKNTAGIWDKQVTTIPEVPGGRGSISKAQASGQDYEIRFVVKRDLYIMDFASAPGQPVDQTAANSFAKLQYQKGLAG